MQFTFCNNGPNVPFRVYLLSFQQCASTKEKHAIQSSPRPLFAFRDIEGRKLAETFLCPNSMKNNYNRGRVEYY